MPRDLFEATMQGWDRLDDRQRQRFAEAFLRAALRLERQEFREWLMRRLIEPPPRRSIRPASPFRRPTSSFSCDRRAKHRSNNLRNAIWELPG